MLCSKFSAVTYGRVAPTGYSVAVYGDVLIGEKELPVLFRASAQYEYGTDKLIHLQIRCRMDERVGKTKTYWRPEDDYEFHYYLSDNGNYKIKIGRRFLKEALPNILAFFDRHMCVPANSINAEDILNSLKKKKED